MKKLITTIAIFTLLSTVSKSQSVFDFLRMDVSPRAAALAGAFVANTDDPNLIFYNPAGLNLLTGQQVSFSYLKHLLDINSASVAYSRIFEKIGRVSGGIQYINYGKFTRADKFGNKTGEFGAADMAFLIAYSNEFDKNFYYGANVKFIYSGIDDRYSTAIAFDVGLLYSIPAGMWNFGFSISNAGTQLSSYAGTKESLPLDVKIGISKTLAHLPFTFYISIDKLNREAEDIGERLKAFSLGGEFRFGKVIRLRFGFDNEARQDLKIGTGAGLAGLNIGLGMRIARYRLDYAYSSLGSIGGLHRIGITTEF